MVEPGALRGRRSAEHARATRAALVDLAGQLFAERGYLQTSIRDIARHASVTSGAIYGHFRSKAELLVEAINTKTADELEAGAMGLPGPSDYVDILTLQARDAPERRQLRALIVQGAAAAHTDDETRRRLRDEQLAHLRAWTEGYLRHRDRVDIDPSADIETVVLYTWAVELGLGVLEALGIEPRSFDDWADIQNRLARGLALPRAAVTRSPNRSSG